MARRSYGQDCALSRSADIIGERWTILLLRDLLVRPRRYGELLRSLKGIGTNLLATRINQLEADGLLVAAELPGGAPGYELTQKGRGLEAIVLPMIRWSLTYLPRTSKSQHHQDDWDLLAAKALFDPERANRTQITVAFRSGFETVRLSVGKRQLSWSFEEGPSDAQFEGTISELFAQYTRKTTDGQSVFHGDANAIPGFLACFLLSG